MAPSNPPAGDEDIRFQTDEFLGQRRQALGDALGGSKFQYEIPAFDVAEIGHAAMIG